MDVFLMAAIALVIATAFWMVMRLTQRVELLEQEVRWLRKELEALKPVEIKSAYD